MMSNCVKESENNPDQVHCKELTKDEKVALFKNRVYVPPENDSNEKEIFYFVREPSMRTKNVFGQQYIDFLNFMEGKANKIIIKEEFNGESARQEMSLVGNGLVSTGSQLIEVEVCDENDQCTISFEKEDFTNTCRI